MNALLPPLSNTHNLGFGCSTLGGSTDIKTSLRMLEVAYGYGICHFDVARSYGYGQAESILGHFLKGKRPHVVITSKFGIAPPRSFPFMEEAKSIARKIHKISPALVSRLVGQFSPHASQTNRISPSFVRASLETSLSELGTDYLDIYLLHNLPYSQVIREDIWHELEKAKEAGKIRAWGATCESKEELDLFLELGSPLSVLQHPFIFDRPSGSQPTHSSIQKIIFSVMRLCGSLQTDPPPSFFKHLAPNLLYPGLIENIREAWLYIAAKENPHAKILCSMTREEHIVRNLKIMETPGLSEETLATMRKIVTAGKYTGEPILSKSSQDLHYPLEIAA